VALIDSARQTALVVERQLEAMRARAPARGGGTPGALELLCDGPGPTFERLAARFLGAPVGQPILVTPEMLEAAEEMRNANEQ